MNIMKQRFRISLQPMPNGIIKNASMTIASDIHLHLPVFVGTMSRTTESQPGMAPRAGLGHKPIAPHYGLSVWLWEDLGWVEDV